MPTVTHRFRFAVVAAVLVWLALVLLTRPAHGGWGVEPVQVHATGERCPIVAACDDGHYGAIIVWQEDAASGGLLKARHLLAGGDVDPGWAAPAVVSTADVARVAAGAVSDLAGGAYVWWMEGAQLFLTRLSPAGVVAPGWPALGRSLGDLTASRNRPSVEADGSGGIYLAWVGGSLGSVTSVRAIHLGPANTGAGGWPTGPRELGTTAQVLEIVNSAAIAAATDGGLWLALATTDHSGPDLAPGEVRVARFTSAGLPKVGWDARGVPLAQFRGELLSASPGWGQTPGMGLVAIAGDGGSGAYVMRSLVSADGGGRVMVPEFRLLRVLGDGAVAAGWPPEGLVVGETSFDTSDLGFDASLRALADGRGGVFAGVLDIVSEGGSQIEFARWSPDGTSQPGGIPVRIKGIEVVSRGDGGMFGASFFPYGASGPFSPAALIAVAQSPPGGGFFEGHDQPVAEWFGDVGLTATGDGGAIFAWSQKFVRYGIYAVRLGPGGVVTGVPPTPVVGPLSLRLRFVRGEGVHASVVAPLSPLGKAAIAGSLRVALSLLDVAGRRVSSLASDGALGADVLLPDTQDLPGGVYFAVAHGGGRELHARVIVLH